jgi:hypothetical protein
LVTISYSIDGGPVTNTSWSGNLTNCSNQSFTLPTLSNLSAGTHVLSVTTSILNDGNVTNNTKTSYVIANDSGVVNEINTFENSENNLIAIDSNGMSNIMWERGLIGIKTNFTNLIEGSNVYITKLSGNYPDKTKSYLVSKCYDLTNVSNPKVEFDMGFDLEPNFDILYLQTSFDGGVTWSNLGAGISNGWYNNEGVPNATDCQNCVGGQWSGTLETKNHYSYNLPLSSNIMLRFVMQSDDAVNNDGVFIDNFAITGTLATNEKSINTFTVYPNPSKGIVNINLDKATEVKISLYDLSGRNIYNSTYNNSTNYFTKEINFNPISEGIYMLNIEVEGKKVSKKIIVK